MMGSKKPTYEELERQLADAEAIIATLRRGEVDAIISERNVALLRVKELEDELRRSEENFRSSLERSPLGICIVTAEEELLYTNQAMLDICGYSSVEELKAMPTKDRYIPKSYAEHQKRKEKRKRGVFVPSNYEISIVRKDGEVRHLAVSCAEVTWNGEGQFEALYWDITERKKVEQLQAELLANISHELRTPLATIKGYSTMLLDYDTRLGRDEKRLYMESIDKATDRQVKLIDELLDMSQIEAGLTVMEKAPTSISKLIREAVAESQIRAPRHKMVMNLPKRLPRMNIDARRIRQVLDNLIDNAAKYSREGTEIVVSAQPVRRGLQFSVSDQGVGIPAQELPKVFSRQYRSQRRLIPGAGGVGLGLSISKALVEAHRGRIWVESEPTRGSTFFFRIP